MRRSILLVLIAGIGDFVMATKAIRAIRRGDPASRIDILTSSEGAAIAQAHPGVNRVWAFPIRELRCRHLPLGRIARVLCDIRRTRYDLALNLYPLASRIGSIKMSFLFRSLNAETKINRTMDDTPHPAGPVAHMVDRMCAVAANVGGQPDRDGLELRLQTAGAECRHAMADCKRRSPAAWLIGVNPGGDRPNRRWPASKFAEVARELAGRFGARTVILGGPREEPLGRIIQDAVGAAGVNLAGRIHLQDLPYVISRCDLLITNDSGPMHIAAALKVPVVAVFGPENMARCRPYTSPDLYRALQKPVACRPCGKARCADPICLESISPDEVLRASVELLGPRPAGARAETQGKA